MCVCHNFFWVIYAWALYAWALYGRVLHVWVLYPWCCGGACYMYGCDLGMDTVDMGPIY